MTETEENGDDAEADGASPATAILNDPRAKYVAIFVLGLLVGVAVGLVLRTAVLAGDICFVVCVPN